MMSDALNQLLVSAAQIYFQKSPAFGLVLLVCLYLTDPLLACGGLLGAAAACGIAWAAGFPVEERRQGLYSFNAALAGIALCASYQFCGNLVVGVVVVGVASSLLSHAVRGLRLHVLTSFFVLTMWLFGAAAEGLGLELRIPPAQNLGAAFDGDIFPEAARSIGAISFVNGEVLGAMLTLMLVLQLRRGAAWMLFGALVGLVSGELLQSLHPTSGLARGMAMNGALMGLGAHVYAVARLWRIGGIVCSCALCLIFASARIPAYTAPFVMSSWLMLWGRGCPPRNHQVPPPAR